MILDKENPELVKKYKEFVDKSPYAIYGQSMNWASVKHNWDSEYVYIERDGEIVAALSLLIIKAVGQEAFMYGVKGPICNFADIDLVEELIEACRPVAEQYQAFLLRMDPEVPYDSELVEAYRNRGHVFRSQEAPIHSFSNPHYAMIISLKDKTEEEVFMSFSSRIRNQVRSSARKGCETSFYTVSDPDYPFMLDTFYDLLEETSKRQQISYRPKDYFVRLMKAFPANRLYVTRHEGDILSAAIALNYGKKLFYIYAASSSEKRKMMPVYHMLWEMIRFGIANGQEEFDLGGVYSLEVTDGLYLFKSGFCQHTEFIGELDTVYHEETYQQFLNQ